MHSIPSPSIALESMHHDGDLDVQDLQEPDTPSETGQGPTERHQEPVATTNEVSRKISQEFITKKSFEPQYSVFLCLRGRGLEEYALQIPCDRESEPGTKPATFFEDGATIYRKLNTACYQHYGGWKKWIPFYGVVDAFEVTFHFLSATEQAHQFRILISQLNYDAIQLQTEEELKELTALRPEPQRFDFNPWCHDGWHTEACEEGYKLVVEDCVEEDIKAARGRVHKMKQRRLMKECAMYPARAQTLQTLNGIAQQSPILEKNLFKIPSHEDPGGSIDALPGIEFVLGWQTERFFSELPRVWLVIAAIWFVVVIFGTALGDWSLSVGLGQLLAALVVIVFAGVKYQGPAN